jgi:hypothetical protein
MFSYITTAQIPQTSLRPFGETSLNYQDSSGMDTSAIFTYSRDSNLVGGFGGKTLGIFT